MFALIILDEVLIFDELNNYGLYKLDNINLNGYKIINNYKDVLKHYKNNNYENDRYKIERYSVFLFKVCQKYIKDYSF